MSRNDKLAKLIKELAAEFLERESNRTSLITVTSCALSPDGRRASLFISVLPEEKEIQALRFAGRKISRLREHIGDKIKSRNTPYLEIKLDSGEKNRQRIEELLREN